MKINDEKPFVESSGDMDEHFFSIQDQGMIFDILRNKMYSDPILAICREISCNARDAHREVEKTDVPIHITLPNSLEAFYKIKDFGPGISPDRMQNVFIKYTASTKRNDNVQTGGFGLGAKTPFSYSDTFTIVTNVDGVKYNYACYIDETKVGKLNLMHQEPTEDPNGTEIIIPVKFTDFNRFSICTEQCTRHWSVKPTISGNSIQWQTYASVLEGSTWKVASSNSHNNYYDRGVKIIVDGIEYSIAMEALKKFADTSTIDAIRGYLFLEFNVGDLSLAANRESIYIDKQTEHRINEKLSIVKNEIIKSVSDKINTFPSYLEANEFYKKDIIPMFHNIAFLGTLKWHSTKLHGQYLEIGCKVTNFYRGKYIKGKLRGTERIKSNHSHYALLEKKSIIYFNDLGFDDVTYKHVKKPFEDQSVLNVQVLHSKESFAELDKEHALSTIGCELLSTITNLGAPKSKAVTSNKLILFKSDYSGRGFSQVAMSVIKEDLNSIKVLCRFKKKSHIFNAHYDKDVILKDDKVLYQEYLYGIFSSFKDKVSFYAIHDEIPEERIKKEFSDLISLDDFITKYIVDAKIDYIGIRACENIYIRDHNFDNSNLETLIKDQNSLFIKKINSLKKIKDLQQHKALIRVYESVVGKILDKDIKDWFKNNPDYDYNTLCSKCVVKYPLIIHDMMYHYNKNDIAQYINFIDSI